VNEQSCTDWEHLVIIDGLPDCQPPQELLHPQRQFLHCETPHKNWGNTCRHNAWLQARGDYVYYLDDDSYLADPDVLETLKQVTKPWAIFPIAKLWFGGLYFHCPPQCGFTDAGNMLIKRGIGQYLDVPNYEADGMLAEQLRKYPMEALLVRPLLIKPTE
jgi:hypothetical protein